MTGSEALMQLKLGVRMRRMAWLKNVYAIIKDDTISMTRDMPSQPQYIMAISDLLHDDWEVYL